MNWSWLSVVVAAIAMLAIMFARAEEAKPNSQKMSTYRCIGKVSRADPYNCSQFFTCDGDKATPQFKICDPPGTQFNAKTSVRDRTTLKFNLKQFIF